MAQCGKRLSLRGQSVGLTASSGFCSSPNQLIVGQDRCGPAWAFETLRGDRQQALCKHTVLSKLRTGPVAGRLEGAHMERSLVPILSGQALRT